jgi:DinB superfamily
LLAGDADDARASLLGRLAEQRAELLEVIGGLSEEDLDRVPGPGAWNARQQLAHLAEMEGIWLAWRWRQPGAAPPRPRPCWRRGTLRAAAITAGLAR